MPAFFVRVTSSTAIPANGFHRHPYGREIDAAVVVFTFASTTRLTGTRIFVAELFLVNDQLILAQSESRSRGHTRPSSFTRTLHIANASAGSGPTRTGTHSVALAPTKLA
jgi:hypothetical protein